MTKLFGTLLLKNVRLEDAGIYKCYVVEKLPLNLPPLNAKSRLIIERELAFENNSWAINTLSAAHFFF